MGAFETSSHRRRLRPSLQSRAAVHDQALQLSMAIRQPGVEGRIGPGDWPTLSGTVLLGSLPFSFQQQFGYRHRLVKAAPAKIRPAG